MSVPPDPPPHPSAPYPPGPHGATPPASYGPPPVAPRRSNRGCLIALSVIGVIFVGIVAAAIYGLYWLGDRAEEAIGTTGPCPYVSAEEASEAVGTDAEATLFSGGLGRVLNITDARVLPDKESCIIQGTSSGGSENAPGLGRTVRYVGGDAGALYDRELIKAKGITEDRGNGVTMETQSYFNHDVSGLGDRAFCTKSSGTLAGVLAVRGDTLVYVAVTRADVDLGVDLTDPGNGKITTDDPACESSTAVARRILDRA